MDGYLHRLRDGTFPLSWTDLRRTPVARQEGDRKSRAIFLSLSGPFDA